MIKIYQKKREHIHLNFINYKKGKPANAKFNKISTIKCPKKYSRPEYTFDINYESQYLIFKKCILSFIEKKIF